MTDPTQPMPPGPPEQPTEPTQPAPEAQPTPDAAPAAAPVPESAVGAPLPGQVVPPAPPAPPAPSAPGAAGGPPPGPRPPIYPMITTFDETVTMSRLWGIPLLGVLVRVILLIPHYVVLVFYAMIIGLLQLVMWIPVLVNGQYPGWGYSIVGGYVRWITRVQAYAILAASAYPPLSTGGRHDVDVQWDEAQPIPRWAGIPLIGIWIRSILLIPHLIILWLLAIAVGFLSLITWAPVLVNGQYARWAYGIVGGFIRWQNRITCYLFLMTGPYPPFSLED